MVIFARPTWSPITGTKKMNETCPGTVYLYKLLNMSLSVYSPSLGRHLTASRVKRENPNACPLSYVGVSTLIKLGRIRKIYRFSPVPQYKGARFSTPAHTYQF